MRSAPCPSTILMQPKRQDHAKLETSEYGHQEQKAATHPDRIRLGAASQKEAEGYEILSSH